MNIRVSVPIKFYSVGSPVSLINILLYYVKFDKNLLKIGYESMNNERASFGLSENLLKKSINYFLLRETCHLSCVFFAIFF